MPTCSSASALASHSAAATGQFDMFPLRPATRCCHKVAWELIERQRLAQQRPAPQQLRHALRSMSVLGTPACALAQKQMEHASDTVLLCYASGCCAHKPQHAYTQMACHGFALAPLQVCCHPAMRAYMSQPRQDQQRTANCSALVRSVIVSEPVPK